MHIKQWLWEILMPDSILARQHRLLILFMIILLAFMVIAGTLIVSQQRHLLLEDEHKRAQLELDLISQFISDSFLRRDYSAVSQFLRNWSEQREQIVTLSATLKNSFELISYQRKTPAVNSFPVQQTLTFSSGNSITLSITNDMLGIETIIVKLDQQLVLMFIAIVAILGIMLWITLTHIALNPLNAEIVQRTGQLNQVITENLRMGAELQVSRRLQQMVLPTQQELNQIEELDIACFMEPAEEVGGDYFDVLQHDGRIKIGIGDVTGHGLESGVLMLMVQMAVRTLLANGVTDPKAFMEVLNQVVFDNVRRMKSDKNMTLALLDYCAGRLKFTGQHEEILLVRANAKIERIDTIDMGFMVGLEKDISRFIEQAELMLAPGDGIVLYTDGLTEARNGTKKPYSLERLCKIVSENWHLPSKAIQQAVISDLYLFVEGEKLLDDVTLLIIKQKSAFAEAG